MAASSRRAKPQAQVAVPRIELRIVGRSALRRGQPARVRLIVSGLAGLRRPVTLRIENRSPAVVRLGGGDIQRLRLSPKDVDSRGRVSCDLHLTARAAGSFALASWLGRVLLAHLESFSKAWGAHAEARTSAWLGDDHSLEFTQSWTEQSHAYDASKRWIGRRHGSDDTREDEGKHHAFEESRKWRGYGHQTDSTLSQERNGHSFDRSVDKGWQKHTVKYSLAWDKEKHDYDESRKWRGDGHDYNNTIEEGWSTQNPFRHDYEDTRDWRGDRHSYAHSRRWKEGPAPHEYEKSKERRADESERGQEGGHFFYRSDEWWDRDHSYETSLSRDKEWKRSGHEMTLSDSWWEKGHDFEVSKKDQSKKDKEKKGK